HVMEHDITKSEPPGGSAYAAVSDLEAKLGASLRRSRLDRNLEQTTVAERAGISLRSLQRLELGQGSPNRALISGMTCVRCREWLKTIAPVASITPLTMPRTAKPRERAGGRRKS